MPREYGTKGVADRALEVQRAIQRLMVKSPEGWFTARQIQEEIGRELGKPPAGSTVREIWRLGRLELRKRAWLKVRVREDPENPEEFEYQLRVFEGRKIVVPASDYLSMSERERDALFPPRQPNPEESAQAFHEGLEAVTNIMAALGEGWLETQPTEVLEREIRRREHLPAPSDVAEEELRRLDPKRFRPVSTRLLERILAEREKERNALTALQRGFRPPPSPQAAPGGRPSPRSGGRRTPSRPRAGRGPRGRRPPSPPSSRPR